MKRTLSLALCLILSLALLAGCGAAPLPDGLTQESVTDAAAQTVAQLNDEDYDALFAGMTEEMTSAMTAEDLAAVWQPVLEAAGAFDSITKTTVGGKDAWVMLGHVYFDRVFSAKFREILEQVYHLPETVSKLWESFYLDHIKSFDMVIRRYPDGVIHEFDSVDELRDFDPLFMENVDSEVFDHIADTLGCAKSEIRDFYPLKQGITNLSCHFAVGDDEYVYRHPGIGTEKIVDRSAEFAGLRLAAELGIDDTFLTGDPAAGWKISRFVRDVRNLDVTRDEELKAAMEMDRALTPPVDSWTAPSTLSPKACATRASSRPSAPSTCPDTLSCATRSCG